MLPKVPDLKFCSIIFGVIQMTTTAWKVSLFGVFLIRIFPYSDWIRRDTEYSVRMREYAGYKNFEYRHFLCTVQSFAKYEILIYKIKQNRNFYGKFIKFFSPIVKIFCLVGTSEVLLKFLTFLRHLVLHTIFGNS